MDLKYEEAAVTWLTLLGVTMADASLARAAEVGPLALETKIVLGEVKVASTRPKMAKAFGRGFLRGKFAYRLRLSASCHWRRR